MASFLELRDISKRFGGVHALRGVNLDVAAGSVHALVGENGAGKSTLGKIVAGALRPDAGEMRLDGRPVRYAAPREALDNGTALIAQELALAPNLTVLQNVFLGTEGARLGLLGRHSLRRRYFDLDRFGFNLPPDARVGALRAADQQKVEILRAIAREVRLIVMDEPTSSLTPDEAARLFDVMREQARQGVTIIYVSHDLESVLGLADTITILRDGSLVRTAPAASETMESLVTSMIGRSLQTIFPARRRPADDAPVILSVRDLATAGWVRDVSFDVRQGEIVGLAGLIGSGRSEVALALAGGAPSEAGEVRIDDRPVKISSPRGAVRHGLALLPESRKAQGLVLGASVLDNVTLPHLNDFSRGGVVGDGRRSARVRELAEQVDLKASSLKAPVSSLSGGNQQKVMFAKWLVHPPRVLIADEPTRGVDIGAKQAIYRLLAGLAERGMGILLISSELEEVLELSHRVLVMRQGRLAGELGLERATEEAVLGLAFGAAAQEAA